MKQFVVMTMVMMLVAAGCGGPATPDAVNRSTRSETDPARFEQAKVEAERQEREARAAEAAALGGRLEVENP